MHWQLAVLAAMRARRVALRGGGWSVCFLLGFLHVVSRNDEERGQLCSGSTASSRREESGGAWVQVDVGGMWMYRWMYRWMLQWESDGVVMITRRPHRCGRASAVARQKEESVTIRVRIYIHT